MRLLIVDDHEVVREGLLAALAPDERFEVVAAAGSAAEALSRLDRVRPDVAVVDLRLPDMPGDTLCRALREKRPGLPVVILSSYTSEDAVRSAMRAGAWAYIAKAAGLSELRDVLARASADPGGDPPIVEQLHRLLVRREDASRTTPQQERVLELAAEGLTYQRIGDQLCISESTVRFHMQKLKGKLGARTKTDLIAKAIRAGIIAPAAEEHPV
jgi:DNA-binding NarL/FixJ family response regulator